MKLIDKIFGENRKREIKPLKTPSPPKQKEIKPLKKISKPEEEAIEGCSMKANYVNDRMWGNHIDWTDSAVAQFKQHIDGNTIFDVWGHLPIVPEVGDTYLAEFQRTFMKFVFVEVKRESDPPDMFFAKVKIIKQELKEDKSGERD